MRRWGRQRTSNREFRGAAPADARAVQDPPVLSHARQPSRVPIAAGSSSNPCFSSCSLSRANLA